MRGEVRVALLGGAECMYTRQRARREPKVWLAWEQADDPLCPVVIGDDRPGTSDEENAHVAVAPTHVYPLFETALRFRAGRGIEDHQRAVSELWATFAGVAAENPHAWSPEGWSATEIRTPGPDNRVVAFPYLKRMCANLTVDQAAAVLLCSYEAAQAAGVPDDRMVFPLAGAEAHDHWFVTTRASLHESLAIAEAGRAALTLANVDINDVAHLDLYSCFPSAVQMAMEALELRGPMGGDERHLTVTGGLAFAGGPANNYPMHAIAALADRCRNDPGSIGMVTALGWYATKHAIGLYSTSPPRDGFVRADAAVLQARLDATPSRDPAGGYDGEIEIEATSVVFERDGTPTVAILAGLTPHGRRALATTRDPDVMGSMTTEPWEGRRAQVRTDGNVNTLGGN